MQTTHPLAASEREHSAPPDLGLQVERVGGHVVVTVPRDVEIALRTLTVTTAEELAGVIKAFPTLIADALGWHVTEVVEARKILAERLLGIIPADFFEDRRLVRRGYGALYPNLKRPPKS